jgi:hypothetical protein
MYSALLDRSRHVKIMNYEPRNPYHLRYRTDWQAPREILKKSNKASSP